METRANYIAVGAFVLVTIAGLFVAMLWLAGAQFRQEYAYFRSYFQGPVTGLGAGASVRLNGIEVGRVTALDLDPNNPEQVVAVLQIRPNVQIHSDALASLEIQGLTGSAYIEISGGTKEASPLPDTGSEPYPVLRSRPSSLQEVVSSVPAILSRLMTITERLSSVVDARNQTALADTLENLRVTTGAISHHAKDFDQIIADSTTMIHALTALSQTLNDDAGDLRGVMTNANGVVTNANGTVRKLDQLTGDLDALVQANRSPLKDFTSDGLPQLTQLIGEARVLVASLTRVSNDLEHDPGRFLLGDRRQGYTPR